MKGKSTHLSDPERDRELSRSEDSKLRILMAATSIFAKKGLDGSRVDEIASAAHINKRMIYHYFESKENLYLEVLRHNYNKLYTIGTCVIQPGTNPQKVIMQVVREYFYFLAEHDEFVRLVSWEALNDQKYSNKVLPQFLDLAEPMLRGILTEGQRTGVLRDNLDIRHLLVSINAVCLGYFSRRETLKTYWLEDLLSPAMLEERFKHIVDLICNGIIKHGEE
ncbi:TetR/AcrR family transcriptional regulator [Desulfosporosinus sp. Sb-LF]|uniref:TetR/AcrR family transcriptional regulator n=1 Tax=Desulfosporosinus sp. Sb-LF TaxID=2560027 RepID=UPI001FB0CA1B|nr:TetR/AcrR family transcriptional regulator [Desulfosporosinus sp. Sb-LF]